MKTLMLQRLREAGFDLSRRLVLYPFCEVLCSQCEALVINGIATHETGCPNSPREEKEED